jgi:hypothetical protein
MMHVSMAVSIRVSDDDNGVHGVWNGSAAIEPIEKSPKGS